MSRMIYRCPKCYAEIDHVYCDKDSGIVGCEECIELKNTENILQSEEEKEADGYANYLFDSFKDERNSYA